MKFSTLASLPAKQPVSCMIIAVFESQRLSKTAEELDRHSKGYIKRLLSHNDLEGKLGQTLLLYNVPNVASERLLLVGGGTEELTDTQFKELIVKAISALKGTQIKEALCYLTELPVKGRSVHWKVRMIVEVAEAALYQFDTFKTKPKKRPALKHLLLMVNKSELSDAKKALIEGDAIAKGVSYTKDLGNTPPNVCTPSFLAQKADALTREFSSLSLTVLEKQQMEKLGMGALLAVAKGSSEPPKFIIVEYKGKKSSTKPIVLIGKGITFDTGGNAIKQLATMVGMKYDMSGGAAVLGTLMTIATLELPISVVGIIPAAENMLDGSAYRPEDILTSMSGTTIEVLNTDAEGRLVLCDALTYCERFNPELVIDIATLTSACIMALGRHASALFTNFQPLGEALLKAGQFSTDRCWQMPLWEEYQEQLNSPWADVANVGGPEAPVVTAACFLERFAKKHQWAHLDIAGVAARSPGKDRSATGRPLPLLVQFLLDYSQNRKK